MGISTKVVPDATNTYIDVVDGAYVLHTTPAMYSVGRDHLKTKWSRYVAQYVNPLPANVYVRCHPDDADRKHLVDGTHRGSINHATGEVEGGLSVAIGAELPWACSLVSGTVVGNGTDGEPLLDLATVQVVSRMYSADEWHDKWQELLTSRLAELGMTRDDYIALLMARLVF